MAHAYHGDLKGSSFSTDATNAKQSNAHMGARRQ